ncbi:MAG: MmgE/PrpD family protein [Clostridium sp.]
MLAEYEKKTGQELLLAELCGYEVTARIGMALGVSAHRNLGWHATSTAGVIGAAAACAKLLGLTEDQIVYAMGMAAQEGGRNLGIPGETELAVKF